jgi:hypothetical protein
MLEVEVQEFESSGEQDNIDLVIGKAWKWRWSNVIDSI